MDDKNKNDKNEGKMQTFLFAFEKYRDNCAKISREIQSLRLHESMLTYSGPENDFNVLAAEYKSTHTYLDLIKEAAAVGRRICFLNKTIKNETGGDTFLPRRYSLQENTANLEDAKEAGNFFRDGFEIVQLFSEMYVKAAAQTRTASAS